MRIGMSYVFDGKIQLGVPFFAEAMKYAAHLPVRDRNLLDAYADIWFKQQINDAVVKLRTLANNYPDDAEINTFGAIVAYQISKDTTNAINILNHVLQIEPKFSFARGFLMSIYQDLGQYDKAIEQAKEIKKAHPESPSADKKLGSIYTLEGKFDDAIAANLSILNINPNDPDALYNIQDIYIRKRDFSKAAEYLEKYKAACKDDPFLLREYYKGLANVSNWSGKFLTGMKYRHVVLDISKQSADSGRVTEAYGSLFIYFQQFGFTDSAIYYCRQSAKWTPYNSRINVPISLVALDAKLADSLRPDFEKDIANLRSRLPVDLQANITQVENLFDGLARGDTAELIAAYEVLTRNEGATAESKRGLAKLEVASGRYSMAKTVLEHWLNGKDLTFTGSGFYYPYSRYLLGMAYEGLGDTKTAIKNYQEMLKYWNNPEIEIPSVKDAKARLARLIA
jgi:tetratricopeptide (TPR) repeat protein